MILSVLILTEKLYDFIHVFLQLWVSHGNSLLTTPFLLK